MKGISQNAIESRFKDIEHESKDGSFFTKMMHRKRKRGQAKFIQAKNETMDSQSVVQEFFAGQDTGIPIPSRSDDTVAVVGRTFNYTFAL